ncbi:hypothetical protein BFJ63_vAg5081 [Fusarium oxysporum f. sp. narcissi]|uniref:Uncharacterized protein n=4 Tax=Fusarium oxysporum TaxID=5507 RepID=A0A420QDW4_FUSOX|nr:hypothetical protein FOWG_01131 [Fusarium oxysporum f. sp. lycopersici MN25]KAF5256997.1 hypothetical protein FOXYS1_12498 [Fusarium oxysporum]PCD44023.1 hypothetical protein AU210_003105 [Fusarium oxysporum f. sp. radicis-cucumerinum]RKK17712.1 hypothetical protein BFJ65_g8039 [Fusarium oxysporum f. sp. cepae]RYC92153.1 hypothetical protein BFJ63_vAg5081 [Fusarium oxysporum f. sp. narcissi]
MAADSLPNSNSKTQSSKSCLCSGSIHGGSSRSSSSASNRCSHCSFRAGSPPPGRPAPGDRDMNALEHFYLSNSATGVANGNDPLGDDLGAQWEDSKKLDHQMPHHMPKLPKLN